MTEVAVVLVALVVETVASVECTLQILDDIMIIM